MSQENTIPDLTLQDLMMVINIINLAFQREKFNEEEQEQIAPSFSRIVAFIDAKKAELEAQNSEEA